MALTGRLRREVEQLKRARADREAPREIPSSARDLARACGLPDLDPWQEDLLESAAPRVLLNICRQAGKSTISGLVGLREALLEPESLVLCLSPSLRQSQELFSKMAAFNARLGRPVPANAERRLSLDLRNGSRIVALPGSERTIRGFSGVDLLIVDEAARVEDSLYFATRPMIAVSGGRLILLSTPYGKRGFYHHEWTSGSSTGWERYEVTARECPRIGESFLEEERRSLPEWWFLQEYFCSFEETEDQVFSHAMISGARDDTIEELRFEGDEDLWAS